MNAKTLEEVQSIVAEGGLQQWAEKYLALRQRADTLGEVQDELQVRLLLHAGEFEELAAEAEVAFQKLDADFESLSTYEIQRMHCTEMWVSLQKALSNLEDLRQSASEMRTSIEAHKKGSGAAAGNTENDLKNLESRVDQAGQTVDALRVRLEAAEAEKDRMWSQVQDTWSEALRANLAMVEYRYEARRLRTLADQLGEEADTPAPVADDEELRRLAGALDALIVEAEENFECMFLSSFFYWPSSDGDGSAFCVPIMSDRHNLNIQVEAFRVYRVERGKGVDFIEPVPEERLDDDDPRLRKFFFEGRPAA